LMGRVKQKVEKRIGFEKPVAAKLLVGDAVVGSFEHFYRK